MQESAYAYPVEDGEEVPPNLPPAEAANISQKFLENLENRNNSLFNCSESLNDFYRYDKQKKFVSVLGEKCTLHQLQGCLQSLQSVTQGNEMALVTTRPQLLTVCSNLKESVWCVDDHMKHCFSPTQTQVFNQVVAGARQFLLELCVPGPIQDAYLKHSPCYKNVSLSEEKCAPLYRHLVHLSAQVEEGRNVDDGLRESCCAFNEFVLCKYIYVSQDCGQEATLFLQQHLERISSPLLQEHCAHYTYGEDSCSNSLAHSQLRHSFLSLIMAITLILLLTLMPFR